MTRLYRYSFIIQELLSTNYHDAINAALSFMAEFIALNLVETKRSAFTHSYFAKAYQTIVYISPIALTRCYYLKPGI